MTNLQRFNKRALAFIEHFNIVVEHLSIFPIGSELERIEYVMHELAHAFTMGFLQMSQQLPQALEITLGRYSVTTSDHLEIDASLATHKAMAKLGLVKPEELKSFAAKCADALSSNRYHARMYLVLDEMEERENDDAIKTAVSHLVCMMRAPLQEVLVTYSLPDDPADARQPRAVRSS